MDVSAPSSATSTEDELEARETGKNPSASPQDPTLGNVDQPTPAGDPAGESSERKPSSPDANERFVQVVNKTLNAGAIFQGPFEVSSIAKSLREVTPGDQQRVKHRFVPPASFDAILTLCERKAVLILRGEEGSGKEWGALSLAIHLKLRPFRVLPGWNLTRLSESVEQRCLYIADEASGGEDPSILQNIEGILDENGSKLVIVSIRHKDDFGRLQPLVVDWSRPDDVRKVLHHSAIHHSEGSLTPEVCDAFIARLAERTVELERLALFAIDGLAYSLATAPTPNEVDLDSFKSRTQWEAAKVLGGRDPVSLVILLSLAVSDGLPLNVTEAVIESLYSRMVESPDATFPSNRSFRPEMQALRMNIEHEDLTMLRSALDQGERQFFRSIVRSQDPDLPREIINLFVSEYVGGRLLLQWLAADAPSLLQDDGKVASIVTSIARTIGFGPIWDECLCPWAFSDNPDLAALSIVSIHAVQNMSALARRGVRFWLDSDSMFAVLAGVLALSSGYGSDNAAEIFDSVESIRHNYHLVRVAAMRLCDKMPARTGEIMGVLFSRYKELGSESHLRALTTVLSACQESALRALFEDMDSASSAVEQADDATRVDYADLGVIMALGYESAGDGDVDQAIKRLVRLAADEEAIRELSLLKVLTSLRRNGHSERLDLVLGGCVAENQRRLIDKYEAWWLRKFGGEAA